MQHQHPVAEADQEEDVDEDPDQPRDEAAEVELPDVRHRLATADDGELPLVPVAERRGAAGRRGRRRSCGRCTGPSGSRPGRCRAACRSPVRSKAAASPRTNTSGWPGMVQSGSTMARPIRSSGAPSDLRSGLAVLPAAQMTVCVGMVHPAARTQPGWMSVTSVSVRTSTPSRRSVELRLVAQLSGRRAAVAARPRAASRWPRRDRCGGSRAGARSAGSRRRRPPSRRRSGPPPTTTKVR